jgi:hypothetical protein
MEMRKLEREEAKLIADMKKAAKENNSATTKTLAKSLIRLRKSKVQMQQSVAQLTGINHGMKQQEVWLANACNLMGIFAVNALKSPR